MIRSICMQPGWFSVLEHIVDFAWDSKGTCKWEFAIWMEERAWLGRWLSACICMGSECLIKKSLGDEEFFR